MFSTEVAVQINIGETPVSLFVHNSLIEKHDGKDYLRVYFAGDNGKPANKTVLLPSESFETGSRWLSVPEKEILALEFAA